MVANETAARRSIESMLVQGEFSLPEAQKVAVERSRSVTGERTSKRTADGVRITSGKA